MALQITIGCNVVLYQVCFILPLPKTWQRNDNIVTWFLVQNKLIIIKWDIFILYNPNEYLKGMLYKVNLLSVPSVQPKGEAVGQ